MTDDPEATGATPAGDGTDATGATPARGTPAALSPADAKAQLTTLENDPANRDILLNRADPGHKALIEKRAALTKAAAGEAALPAEAEALSEARYDDDTDMLHEMMENALTPPVDAADYDLQSVRPDENDTLEEFKAGKETAAGWAHDAGLSPAEIAPIIENYNQLMSMGEGRHDPAAVETAQGAAVSTLQGLWKESFDANFAVAVKEAERLGEDFAYFLDETRLGDDPWMIRALFDAANQRTDRSTRRQARQARQEAHEKAKPQAMSPQEAKAKIEKMNIEATADPDHPLQNRRHPGHTAAHDERHRLYILAYPEQTWPS